MRTPKRKAKLVDTAQLSFFDPDGALLDLRAEAQHLSTTLEHCAFLEEGRNRAEVAIAALEKDRDPGAIAALEQNRDELTKFERQLGIAGVALRRGPHVISDPIEGFSFGRR